jgi:hypothetical protein
MEDINKVLGRINLLGQIISQSTPRYLLLGGKLLEGEMKQRIFNQGLNSKATKIGKYKAKQWEKKRAETGRQTDYVDLEYTGQLRNSMQVVKTGKDEVVLAIVTDLDYKKAKGNEERRKETIFLPTDEERASVEAYISDLIVEDFTKNFLSL